MSISEIPARPQVGDSGQTVPKYGQAGRKMTYLVFWMPVASKLQPEARSLLWEGGLRAESPGLAPGSQAHLWEPSVTSHSQASPVSLGILASSQVSCSTLFIGR